MWRVATAFGLLSAWLALLLMGWSFGGVVYLLLIAALALFPWRELRAPAGDGGDRGGARSGS